MLLIKWYNKYLRCKFIKSLLKYYEVFVSYCEDTGESFAEATKRAFARRNLNTFVSSLDRLYVDGFIDSVIRKCQIFILLLTIDTLESSEVQRELLQLKLKGIGPKNFWIFRHNIPEVPRNNENLNRLLDIDLSEIVQFDFENKSDLVTNILRHYGGTYSVAQTVSISSSVNLIKSDYVILDPNSIFSQGDMTCWKTGLFTFNDINGDYDARRSVVEDISKDLENSSLIVYGEDTLF